MSKNMKARERMLQFINSHVGAIVHPDTITAHVGCSKSFLFHLKAHLEKNGAVEDVPGTVGGKTIKFYRFTRRLEICDLAYRDKRTPVPTPEEAEAEKKLKQAHGGFTMKDDPLVDPPGPLFDGPEKMAGLPPYVTGRGAVAALDAGITPLLQIVKAIKQSEAAILCHMDKMDERELKRFRILEEKLAHIASTAERWAEIESRLGKLALSAGRIPALESKVAILTEEIRKARREVGFMNPKLDKLCKEWGVKP